MAGVDGKAATMFLVAGVFDVLLGLAFILWGEQLPPLAATIPDVFGLSLAKITGFALIGLAAPASFFLYFLRRGQAADKASRPSGPVTRL